jgi:hypothetical protein
MVSPNYQAVTKKILTMISTISIVKEHTYPWRCFVVNLSLNFICITFVSYFDGVTYRTQFFIQFFLANFFWAAIDMKFLWWTTFCSCDHEDEGTNDNYPYFCIWQNHKTTIVTMINMLLVLMPKLLTRQSTIQVLSFIWVF